jgi:hypothetical protein
MNIMEVRMKNWYLQCIPRDGGRISVLKYAGEDLLTPFPSVFRPPLTDLGEFETRPVYGYDDCFPTVDLCRYPLQSQEGRDHGELCWKNWQIQAVGNSLICCVECDNPRATFTRTLEFSEKMLKWKFSVNNLSPAGFPFLHVMHALMPLTNLSNLETPAFQSIIDEISDKEIEPDPPRSVFRFLRNIKPGSFRMLLLRQMEPGPVKLEYNNGLTLTVEYPVHLFPTLGIWWNNRGYPDEEGLHRTEYAIEPIPGSCSGLDKSFKEGKYLWAEPGKPFSWEIHWNVKMRAK